jgi:Ca2+-binding RTX toxin-like protein
VDAVVARGMMSYKDFLIGGNEDDTLASVGMIFGGGGDDTISIGANSSVFGGTGDDVITGSTGSQTYVFNLGDGQDTITDYYSSSYGYDNDKIILGEGIAPEDIFLARDGSDLILSIGDGGDQITIKNHFANTTYQIEQIVFTDGTMDIR